MAQWGFSQSITPKFEHKLRRHEQRFEKLPPRLYQMKMKICYDQGCNEIVADIATKLRHCLFYLELYFSALGTVLSGLLVIPQECPLNTGLAS